MKRLAALALLALAAASCGGDDAGRELGPSGGGVGDLTVFAAASLTEVFRQLAPEATYSFGGSDELATQIREGAPADVYAAASPRFPAELAAEGLLEAPRAFATNRLVLVVPPDNPAGIESLDDLAAGGVRLVLGAEGVPAGDYARQALEESGAAGALENVVSHEEDVKGVLGKVASGEADAGLVYQTEADAAAGDVVAIELPEDAQVPVEYRIGILAGTGKREAAERFVRLLLGEEGRRALAAAGFGLP
ncbi:MAG TPA: molybdate ABC transporter substrate-binding protein [Gaiellaceae bacterium]|nr:molybdate ABC transporter substrate-binding protein [Gaiellaceae bacterium]